MFNWLFGNTRKEGFNGPKIKGNPPPPPRDIHSVFITPSQFQKTVQRAWGYYKILYESGFRTKIKNNKVLTKEIDYNGKKALVAMCGPGYIVKLLFISPGKELSIQKHNHRNELWLIVEGKGLLRRGQDSNNLSKHYYSKNATIHIGKNEWHTIKNTSQKDNLVILETWQGRDFSELREEDIERAD